MGKAERKIKKIVKEYAPKMPLYKDFAFSVKRIIEEIIKKEGLDKHIQIVTAREKSLEGLARKLLNRNFKDNPEKATYLEKKNIKKFLDVKDLAGVRVILYFRGDILKRLRIALQEEFDYSSKDEQRHKDSDGQESIHSWIKFNEKRLSLREYAKFKDLKCEIQLVTILQHAWSELEHDVVYKPKDGWEKSEIEQFDNMFKEAKGHIKKASDIFESIMYIHLNEDKFLLFNEFEKLDNNKLYEYLGRLQAYMEKNYLGNDIVLKDVLEKVEKVVFVAKGNKVVKEKNIFGELEGKTLEEVISKSLNILSDSRIKYFSPDNFKKVFGLAVDWASLQKDEKGKKEVTDFFENLSQYDLNILKQIGLFNQKMIIDIISNWSSEDKIKNIEIIKIVVKKILQPSFESRSMVEWNKLQYSSGSMVEDKKGNLSKIRRKAIDFIFNTYVLATDDKTKFELIKILDEASRTSHSGTSESLEKIIEADINYLIKKYQAIAFDKKGKVICNLPVAMEIERQLLWLKKRWANKIEKKVDDFITKLKKDKRYSSYSQLIDRTRLDYLETGRRQKKGINLDKQITKNNLWLSILNDIAGASKIEEDWKFNDFHKFLSDLAEKETSKSEYFLKDALKNDTPILDFADAFMLGFRSSGKIDLWDKYVTEIEKKNNGGLMSKILHSFYFYFKNDGNAKFRKKDLKWLVKVASRKGKYAYLINNDHNKFYLDYILFRSIIIIWRYEQKAIEKLLISEIARVGIDNASQKIDEIELFASWNDISIEAWRKESIEFLIDCIIKSSRIDYHGEGLAIKIGKIDFSYFLKIIKGRLDLSDKPRRKSKYYDAIPTHLDEEFISFIKQNQEDFKRGIISWISKKKIKYFNAYECGSLLRSLDNIHQEVVIELVKKDTNDSFEKAVGLLRSFDGINIDLAFQVAEYIIKSKKIKSKEKDKFLKQIGGQMYSTGMVSGEHGISQEHKRKADEIGKIKESLIKTKKSKRLISFADKNIKYLLEQSKREFVDEERQIKMMEINFEG